jgi:hypothetical protein
MTRRKFVHTLSFPEHIWIDFFQSFFSQDVLVVDEDNTPVPNSFRYEISQPPENRKFDVLFEHDMKGNNPNILPSLVIEDLGMASLGIATNRLSNWTVSPETSKTRSDLLRSTYIFHCCSKDRGESRLMASIVANAITVFYDQLLRAGFHKLEPWSIGKTIPIKSDSAETYVDTTVSVTFETQQTWKTVESSPGTVRRFCLVVRPDELIRFVRLSVNIADPSMTRFIATSMDVQEPNVSLFVNTSIDLADPLTDERYVMTSMDVADPLFAESFVRTSMRVS